MDSYDVLFSSLLMLTGPVIASRYSQQLGLVVFVGGLVLLILTVEPRLKQSLR